MRCVHVIVRGEVQGVGFRYYAESEAQKRNLSGWVRNLRDGSVEAVAEGEESALHEWLSMLRRGPSSARVTELLPVWEPLRGLKGFSTLPSADVAEPFLSDG
jgi:acylphosphatase